MLCENNHSDVTNMHCTLYRITNPPNVEYAIILRSSFYSNYDYYFNWLNWWKSHSYMSIDRFDQIYRHFLYYFRIIKALKWGRWKTWIRKEKKGNNRSVISRPTGNVESSTFTRIKINEFWNKSKIILKTKRSFVSSTRKEELFNVKSSLQIFFLVHVKNRLSLLQCFSDVGVG